jgi:hypothetical protein
MLETAVEFDTRLRLESFFRSIRLRFFIQRTPEMTISDTLRRFSRRNGEDKQ